jgi:hypothetical protein
VRWALAHPAHYRVMFRPELVDIEGFPATKAQAQRAWNLLAARVEQLVAEGTVEPAEADVTAMLLWSTVHGISMLVLDGRSPLPAFRGDGLAGAEAVARAVAAHLGGARPAPASAPGGRAPAGVRK